MRNVFIFIIKLYWKFIPEHKRRPCIFNESCSRYVYRMLNEEGFKSGAKAFIDRYKKCRPDYKVYYNSNKLSVEIELADQSIVESELMRPGLIKKYLEFRKDEV